MNDPTSTNVPNVPARATHQSNGKFAKGNRLGHGNPRARHVAMLRNTLLGSVTPEDIQAVVMVLLEKAKGGDMAAVRELLDRTVGKPGTMDDDTMTAEEAHRLIGVVISCVRSHVTDSAMLGAIRQDLLEWCDEDEAQAQELEAVEPQAEPPNAAPAAENGEPRR